jgi:hypothetical protein
MSYPPFGMAATCVWNAVAVTGGKLGANLSCTDHHRSSCFSTVAPHETPTEANRLSFSLSLRRAKAAIVCAAQLGVRNRTISHLIADQKSNLIEEAHRRAQKRNPEQVDTMEI